MFKDFVWFSKTSYDFVVNETLGSKIDFVVGFIPAYLKYIKLMKEENGEFEYKELKDYYSNGQGYFNQLSEDDKKKIFLHNPNNPF